MFEVEKTFTFEAGHVLGPHDGACARPHGHSYALTVVVRGKEVCSEGPKIGMVVDFQDIAQVVKPMLTEYFDHRWLNETLKMEAPTAERMARWVFSYLEPKIRGLQRITIRETATSAASYFLDA